MCEEKFDTFPLWFEHSRLTHNMNAGFIPLEAKVKTAEFRSLVDHGDYLEMLELHIVLDEFLNQDELEKWMNERWKMGWDSNGGGRRDGLNLRTAAGTRNANAGR
jgi:hypothetical protein